ncbi:hypothetical protein GH714_028365 [Hevea brasiliensis]|uniref:Bidirectional sugar transporter SWEET n=1 Tax=Hevea brasiliensis TaxID=3981 RepID=A0A6A6MEQ2_HEVBR|nr:hypothetical protein GH714_028365 [Hevea brasiliensis]
MGDRLRLAVGVMGISFPFRLPTWQCSFLVTLHCTHINFHKGGKEEKHRGVFMRSLHHYIVKLSPLHLIKVGVMLLPVLLFFSITAAISSFAFHDHHSRKVFTGSVGLVGSVGMYGSPLVVMKQVIQTKSVEFMPFYLSFFSFLASSLWLAYGLFSRDIFLASPNLLGTPLGILQLVLYCKYRKRGVMEKPQKWDLEKNEDKPKQLQLVVNEDINGKS